MRTLVLGEAAKCKSDSATCNKDRMPHTLNREAHPSSGSAVPTACSSPSCCHCDLCISVVPKDVNGSTEYMRHGTLGLKKRTCFSHPLTLCYFFPGYYFCALVSRSPSSRLPELISTTCDSFSVLWPLVMALYTENPGSLLSGTFSLRLTLARPDSRGARSPLGSYMFPFGLVHSLGFKLPHHVISRLWSQYLHAGAVFVKCSQF